MTFISPESWTRISAVFRPARADDLVEGTHEHVGKRMHFRFAGYVDWDSSYEGQSQWMPERGEPLEVGWVPACDLTDVIEKGDNYLLRARSIFDD